MTRPTPEQQAEALAKWEAQHAAYEATWRAENAERWRSLLVLGHMCDGLVTLNANSTTPCIPVINERGQIEGCDATNSIPLVYCPCCGVKFDAQG